MSTQPGSKVETRFQDPGSLDRPRIIGRAVRAFLGLGLMWGLYVLLAVGWDVLVDQTPPRSIDWWLYIAIAFWLTPAVVNIGFTRDWRRKPQVAILILAGLAMALDLALYGTWWAPPLGFSVWVWLIYFSAHLGFSFILAAIIGTPGCEMRALPHLGTLITGHATPEHYCPGFLDGLDRWERERAARR